jgi:hypothetical protein
MLFRKIITVIRRTTETHIHIQNCLNSIDFPRRDVSKHIKSNTTFRQKDLFPSPDETQGRNILILILCRPCSSCWVFMTSWAIYKELVWIPFVPWVRGVVLLTALTSVPLFAKLESSLSIIYPRFYLFLTLEIFRGNDKFTFRSYLNLSHILLCLTS